MFDFNWNWDWSNWNLDAIAESIPVFDNNWLAQVQQEIAALSTVVTEAVVNSPAVIQAPVNTTPNIDEVEKAVQQVVQAVAPVVAPSLPDYILQLTTPLFVDEIAYSPEVLSAPVGQTVPAKAVETIVQNIVDTATKDETFVNSVVAFIPDSVIQTLPEEYKLSVTEAVEQATDFVQSSGTIDLTNRKTETLKESDALKMKIPSENITEPAPSRFVNNPYLNAITLEPEAMAGSVVERNLEAERIAAIKETQVPTDKEIAAMPPKVAEQVREEIKAGVTTELATLPEKIDAAILKAETDLASILKEAEASIAEAERLTAEAERFAAEGTKAAAEGDKIITDAVESGQFDYMKLADVFKGVVNQQPQYAEVSDAGLAAAAAALSAVGVEGLVEVMAEIRRLYPGIESPDALNLLKFDKRFNTAYLTRFAGNKKLQDAGLGMLDDKTYLATETAFGKIFNAYGLKQFANRDRYSSLIGNSISADELAGRVSAGYDRIVKGAGATKDALNRLFPELNDTDILAYVIDPVNQLPAIQRKIQAAEIGGAALAQNLSIGLTQGPTETSGYTNVSRQGLGVEQLQAQGIDLESARKGYSAVASVLPAAEKLSSIYGGSLQQYGRKQAEQEAFMNLAEAKTARERLSAREIAEFSGEAGMLKSQRRAIGGLI
jgi:hypothetical protein